MVYVFIVEYTWAKVKKKKGVEVALGSSTRGIASIGLLFTLNDPPMMF
jgi:hypothetical protein